MQYNDDGRVEWGSSDVDRPLGFRDGEMTGKRVIIWKGFDT